jgi:hypothetical protein
MTLQTSRLRRITLHMARTKDRPEGSSRHGYDIVAPIDADGRLDPEAWREKHRTACIVHRFWGDEPPRRGRLVHRPGVAGGATWMIDYDVTTDEDDEAGYRLGEHLFVPGAYLSIREADGDVVTFKVVAVGPV